MKLTFWRGFLLLTAVANVAVFATEKNWYASLWSGISGLWMVYSFLLEDKNERP